MGSRVSAPLVTVTQNGRVLYLRHGDVVPDGVDKASLDHLRSLGYVEDADEAPTGASEPPARPAESGPGSARSKWVEYAAFHGVTHDADASREDIAAAVTTAGH